jgi:hypothetical protein
LQPATIATTSTMQIVPTHWHTAPIAMVASSAEHRIR